MPIDVLDALGTSYTKQDCRSPNGSSANRSPAWGWRREGTEALCGRPKVALDTWAVGGHA